MQPRQRAKDFMGTANVLLIEDNEADVMLMKISLDGAGLEYRLTSLRDGAKSLEYVGQQSTGANPASPDIVLLDLNLPKVGGLEVLRQIRAANRFAKIPVVVLSSSQSPGDKAAVLREMNTSFMVKPVDLDGFLELGKKIKDLLDRPRSPLLTRAASI